MRQLASPFSNKTFQVLGEIKNPTGLPVGMSKDIWKKDYAEDPNANFGINFKLSLSDKENGSVIAYFGTEYGYEDRKLIQNTDDIIKLIRNYFDKNF